MKGRTRFDTGAMKRVVNTAKVDGKTFRTSGEAALILTVRYPHGMKPSDVLRAVRREAKRLGVNLMVVENAAGVFNGEGALKGEALPSAFQVIGIDQNTAVAWDAVKALSQHWAFHEYGTHKGATLPTDQKVPGYSRGTVDKDRDIPKNIPVSTTRNIREMMRTRTNREAKEFQREHDKARKDVREKMDAAVLRERAAVLEAANLEAVHNERLDTASANVRLMVDIRECSRSATEPTAHVESFR